MARSQALLFASVGLLGVACSNSFQASGGSGGSAGADTGTGAAGNPSAEAGAAGDAGENPGGGSTSTGGGTTAGASNGGSGGVVNVGGTVAVAGAPPVFTSSKLIDNMEDGNSSLLETNGAWYVFRDNSGGSITPPYQAPFTMGVLSPPRGTSDKAAMVKVANFTGWGAAFGFDFLYKAAVRQQYDLLDYRAVRFWTRSTVAQDIRFQVTNIDTDILGGRCTESGATACGAHWTQAFASTTAWSQVTILFANLKQDMAGLKAMSFDQHHVYSMFFVIEPKQSVTVTVDDIELVK